jgi:hypothetical protein
MSVNQVDSISLKMSIDFTIEFILPSDYNWLTLFKYINISRLKSRNVNFYTTGILFALFTETLLSSIQIKIGKSDNPKFASALHFKLFFQISFFINPISKKK